MNLTQTPRLVLFAFPFLIACFSFPAEARSARAKSLVYVGTYTDKGSKGIYSFQFDPATGGLTARGLAAETPNPTFLALGADHKFLYAANEISSYDGKPTGEVSAFAIDSSTGKLAALNQVSSQDAGPAHIAVDGTGRYVLVANYPHGSVAVFPILQDGRLGEASAFVQHKGSSVNAKRQSGPHAHEVVMSPDNRFVLVADLGLDQVLAYPFDAAKGTLGQPNITKIKPGSGPRHLVFSAGGRFVYLVTEMLSNVTVFSYEAASGGLSELQTVSTLSHGFIGQTTAGEIAIHPSGKFLYASNRGEDSIAVFSIDRAKGTLTPVENVPTQGKTPRNFVIDPSGKWLLAANQDSNNIVSFRIDSKTGRISATGQVVQSASPACLLFDAAMKSNHK